MKLTVNIEKLTIHHALDIYEIMRLVLKREKKIDRSKEHFWVIALNNANRIVNLELVSTGNSTNTIVKPMEVLSIPLQKRAAGVILVHNHPSGKLDPSEADKDLTDLLIQACKLMNIPVLDHVIITENSYYSFKSSGLLDRLEASNKYILPYELERQYHEEMQEEIKKIEKESRKKIDDSLKKERENSNKKIEYIAKQMIQKGYAVKDIEEITSLSQEQILLLI